VNPLAELMPEWSSYAYTYNNPINWTDSTGMCPDGDCPDGVFEDGYKHTTEDGRTYFYMAEEGTWSDSEVLVEHTVTNFEKFSKFIKDIFSNKGGAPIYGSGHPGAENAGSKEGKATMDPIDMTDFYTPMTFKTPFKYRGGRMGPYVNAGEYTWSGFSKGYNAAEAEAEEKLLKTKVSIVDIRFRNKCYTCGTPITSLKDTTILNTQEAKSSLKKYDSLVRKRASEEWTRQLDSILKSK